MTTQRMIGMINCLKRIFLLLLSVKICINFLFKCLFLFVIHSFNNLFNCYLNVKYCNISITLYIFNTL